MSILDWVKYRFSPEGRFESFTIHMLAYPLIIGALALGLCFDSMDRGTVESHYVRLFAVCILAIGLLFLFMFRETRPRASVGIWTIVLIYAVSICIAAFPYIAYGFSPQNAFFDAISGITTTGMSVIHTSELNSALMIWRAVTGWIGGFMFISIFSLYITYFGLPGRYLFGSGSVTVDSDVYKPQIMKIAVRYGEVYLVSTVILAAILMISGTDALGSVSLSMSTVSTTGFMDFHGGLSELSVASRVAIGVFMVITMLNFTTAYFTLMLRSTKPIKQDNESVFIVMWILAISAIAFVLLVENGVSITVPEEFLNYALVMISCASTTGFIVDHTVWPSAAVLVIAMLSLVGGSIDSPGGGMKVSRIAIVAKIIKGRVSDIGFPNEVKAIRLRNVNVSRSLAYSSHLFVTIFMLALVVGVILIMATGMDLLSSFYVATSALTTTGKGLYYLGGIYDLSNLAKCVCAGLMVVGRLEIIMVLMLFIPGFWRDLLRGKISIRQRINDRRLRSLQRKGYLGRHR